MAITHRKGENSSEITSTKKGKKKRQKKKSFWS